jgi:signal transduction histidine kinase
VPKEWADRSPRRGRMPPERARPGRGRPMDSYELDHRFLKSLTILYVEDDDDVREQFAQFLRYRCGRLIVADNGLSALDAFRQHRPQIVVTDILMPVMDGLTMAEEIHNLDQTVLIIVTTAFEKTDYLLRSIEIGVDKYVTKPVNTDRMSAALLDCAHRLRIEAQLVKEMEYRRQSELALIETEILQRAKVLREHVEAEERARVSRDIHDSIGQSLMALKLNLEMLQPLCLAKKCSSAANLSDLISEIKGISEELRDILVALRPAFLETTRLDEALGWLCDRFRARTKLEVQLITSGISSGLDDPVKIAFFRICQEALNNAVRHAKASSVSVSLVQYGEQLRLVVSDNGCGGVSGEAAAKQGNCGFGIPIMRERSKLVQGTLIIDSPSGLGTTITLEAPLS